METTISVRVKRSDPRNGFEARWQEYQVPRKRARRVLDVLEYITEQIDPTLAFRPHLCRDLVCNGCWVRVNGRARMACSTPINDDKPMTLEPMDDYELIRDLVVDYSHHIDVSRHQPTGAVD